ncbi:MAG: SOS response-associated peptidase [Alphaproteobacteria bacterium]
MCNLYRLETSQQAMRRLFAVTEDRLGNLPLLDGIYPDQQAPVIHVSNGARVAVMMRWGLPPPAGVKRPVTNVRNLDSPFWRSLLARPAQRCLVPATAFCEYEGETGSKQKRWFRVRGGTPDGLFAFAGLWRDWEGVRGKESGSFRLFSILTTAPNALVEPIHRQAMPVILDGPAAWTGWLTASWEEARTLVRPLPAHQMTVDPPEQPESPRELPLFGGG